MSRRPATALGRRRLATVLRGLLRFRAADEGPLGWGTALVLASSALVVALLLTPAALAAPTALDRWSMHAAISLEVAINRVALGRASHVDERVCRWLEAGDDPTLTFEDTWPLLSGSLNEHLRVGRPTGPLLELPAAAAGSLERHAAGLVPYAHNESAVTWLVELLLRARPGSTLQDALAGLHALRLGWLWLFALALARGGASPLLVVASLFAATRLLAEALASPPLVALYAGLLPALLATAGGASLLIGARVWRRWPVGAAWAVACGVWATFVINLRTSYAPIVLALLAWVLVSAALDLRAWTGGASRRRRLAAAVAWGLGVALGGLALDRVAFRPAREVRSELNAHHHVVAHPLVLSLALPPNDLARSEGIAWDDFQGIVIARREDPAARYLRPGYEAALFSYYRRLWRERTWDMVRTYAAKLGTAGAATRAHCRGAFRDLSVGSFFVRTGTLPVLWVRHGLLFALLAAVVIVAAWSSARAGLLPRGGSELLGALGLTAALCYLEAALIVSTHSVAYHGFLAFFLVFVGLVVLAGSLDHLRLRCQRAAVVTPPAPPPARP